MPVSQFIFMQLNYMLYKKLHETKFASRKTATKIC